MTYWCTVLKALLLLCVVLPILEPKSGIAMATVYNNPGNIEVGQGYAGETGQTYGKGRFAVFSSPEMGLRALAYDLRSKMKEFDGDINQVIAKYAPANENKTREYANYVQSQIGDNKITEENLAKAVAAVVRMENSDATESTYLGKDLDDFSMINEAIELSRIDLDTNVDLQAAREKLRGSRIDAIPTTTVAVKKDEEAALPIIDSDREMRTIGQGDTLSKIAKEQNMSVDQLLAMNPQIEDPDLIKTGQKLTVRKPEKKGLFGMGLVIPGTGIGFNEGGDVSMRRQMDLFDEGGLKDEGGSVDPISGNDVPVGSLKKEVRDDIPAQLSEGEFVFPADVVRYYGLETLMKMRQRAKIGLQRMEDMGQMGNSDEAILPDDIPFDISDLELEDETPVMMMQEGGSVEDDPYQLEEREEEDDTARVVPTYSDLMGTSGGGSSFTTELRPYVNDAGVLIQIPFFGGQPLYPIPDGFFPQPVTTAEDTAEETTTTTTTTQTEQKDDGEGQAEAAVAKERARAKKIQDTRAKLGITGGGGFNLGALLPFGIGDEVTIGGKKQTMGPPTAEVMKAREQAMENLQVPITGNIGLEPGDLDAATGGVFNIHGIAIDPFTGEAVGKGADASYGNREDYFNVISAGNESGWRGGFIGNKNTNAYRTLNDVQKDKYDNFLDALNTKTGVPTVMPVAPPPRPSAATQMGALGFEGQDITGTGQPAPDFTPSDTGPFTTEGPQFPRTPDGIPYPEFGTGDVTFTTRPAGTIVGGTPGTYTAPEFSGAISGDPSLDEGAAFESTPTPIQTTQNLIQQAISGSTMDESFSPPPAPPRETTPIQPAGLDPLGIMNPRPSAPSSFEVEAQAQRDFSDAEEMRRQDELRRQAEEADRAKAEQQAAADAARIAEDAARAKERREAQERIAAAEAAEAERVKKAEQDRIAAEEKKRFEERQRQQELDLANKHGFKDDRVRDDQGTATKIEDNKVYYSDDHDWSKPTQTTVKEEKDDSDDGCFVKGTPITMKDGSTKPVEEVDIGDEVMLGGFVFAAGRFLVDSIYDYDGIQVSGTHMVLEDDAWVRVKDSRKGKFISDEDTIVYIFGSENRRIMINDTIFTDYFEVTEQERLLDTGDDFFDNWRENGAKESEENVKIRNEELVKKTSMAA